jgi:hypothetical protein
MRSLFRIGSARVALAQLASAEHAPSALLGGVSWLTILFGGSLAGFIYKFGFVRAEMQHARRDVAAQLTKIAGEAKERDEESRRRIDALEAVIRDRFDRLDRAVAALADSRIESERWEGGVESTLEAHDQRLEQVERAVMTGGLRVAT